MCRWIAYNGSPLLLEELLYKPARSLIDQSMHARMGKTTNGDGFGVGWYYEDARRPALFRFVFPAWGDVNLRELAGHVRSPLFFAHVRASSGTAVQQSNCHPFRYQNWLWMHNGAVADFWRVKRDLVLAIAPDLFPSIEGSTDSEVMFYLALTLGLKDDPPSAVERMVGLIEDAGRRHGVRYPMQMTVAVSDGKRMWAFRYSSEGRSRSLFHSVTAETLRECHPDVPALEDVAACTRVVVSEPLTDLHGDWREVPESSYCILQPGGEAVHHRFQPQSPRS
ncbi:MAG: class glutamine amidotransferase [Labilithrix sp.]|jgi:glutamine amidotransferase|nr:class glutamine amidotransferase [Labilithrix sp.]